MNCSINPGDVVLTLGTDNYQHLGMILPARDKEHLIIKWAFGKNYEYTAEAVYLGTRVYSIPEFIEDLKELCE